MIISYVLMDLSGGDFGNFFLYKVVVDFWLVLILYFDFFKIFSLIIFFLMKYFNIINKNCRCFSEKY